MTITEMHERAERTLQYFLESMPDAPFGVSDIVFDFAPPSRMFTRYKALCTEYRPREVILPEHKEQLANGIGGQAIIGKSKSAVLICTKQPYLKANIRRIIFHELMHIYCAKTEVDNEHFIDVYGSGSPYESDEILHDGYFIWSEFVADYYADLYTRQGQLSFESCRDDIINCLAEVIIFPKDNRRYFEWACLNLLTVYKAESVINRLTEPDFIISGNSEKAHSTRKMLDECIQLLHRQMQTDKPWKINEEFVFLLGEAYSSFKHCNTYFRYEQMGGIETALHAYAEQMGITEEN